MGGGEQGVLPKDVYVLKQILQNILFLNLWKLWY
jgi:hypothetical protein